MIKCKLTENFFYDGVFHRINSVITVPKDVYNDAKQHFELIDEKQEEVSNRVKEKKKNFKGVEISKTDFEEL